MVVVNDSKLNTHSNKTITQSLQVKPSSTSSSSNINIQRHSTSSLDERFLFKQNQHNTQPLIIQYSSSIGNNLNAEEIEEDEIRQINRNQEFAADHSTINVNITSYLNSMNVSPSPSSSSSSSSSASATAISNQTKTNQDETTVTITTAHSDETVERNNFTSSTSNGSDDLDDLIISKDAIREEDEYILTDDEDELLESDRLKLNSSKSNVIEEEEEEEEEVVKPNIHVEMVKTSISAGYNKPFVNSLSPHSLACEVASLSSLTSNYSQFDFLHNRASPPPPPQPILSSKSAEASVKVASVPKSSSSLTSFFFSNSIFNKKSLQNNTSDIHSSNSSTLDLITSKLLNLKSTPSATTKKNNMKSSYINNYSSSSSSSSSSQFENDKHSIKSNHSAHNLCMNISADLQVPSSVLIFENRPSNLPAKSHQEALKHKQEYEKMVEIAKKKGILL